MRKTFLLVTFCLPLLLCSCVKRAVDMTGTIYGSVVDADSLTPISGVLLTLSPSLKTKYTGEDGYFEFASLLQQQYTLSVQKEGYCTDRKIISFNYGENVEIVFAIKKRTN